MVCFFHALFTAPPSHVLPPPPGVLCRGTGPPCLRGRSPLTNPEMVAEASALLLLHTADSQAPIHSLTRTHTHPHSFPTGSKVPPPDSEFFAHARMLIIFNQRFCQPSEFRPCRFPLSQISERKLLNFWNHFLCLFPPISGSIAFFPLSTPLTTKNTDPNPSFSILHQWYSLLSNPLP